MFCKFGKFVIRLQIPITDVVMLEGVVLHYLIMEYLLNVLYFILYLKAYFSYATFFIRNLLF